MSRESRCLSRWWGPLLAVVIAVLGCKDVDKYKPPEVARNDGSADGRGGAGGGGGSGAGTGGNTGSVGPAVPDSNEPSPSVDAPVTADGPADTAPPDPTCVANVPCTEGIGPCRQGATTCASPTSTPVCADVGADDKRGGCTGTNVCLGGACVAACATSVPCTDGIKPCRKGATTCATPTSPAACADVGADDSKGGCPGGNVCSNGLCVPPCAPNVPCTQGVSACHRGTTSCASPTAQAVCNSVVDDSKGGCPGGNVCSNGSCVTRCTPNVPCSQGVSACHRGTTSCASPTAQAVCNSVVDDSKGGCPGGNMCMGGNCVAPPPVTCSGQPIGAGRCVGTVHQTCGGNGQWAPDNSTQCKRADGGQCSTGSDCTSGNCVTGICCDSPCTGKCTSCAGTDTGGANGNCRPVSAGSDPRNQCAASNESTCGTDGSCDGAGDCRLHGTNVVCAQATCAGGSATPARRCNGNGSCAGASPVSCGAFPCAGSMCARECPSGQSPEGGRCVKPLGATCGSGTECGSGNCVDGRCCSQSSCPTCQNCGSSGTCGPIKYAEDSGCSGDRICLEGRCESCGNATGGPCCKNNTCAPGRYCTPRADDASLMACQCGDRGRLCCSFGDVICWDTEVAACPASGNCPQ
jgi:hypothetical protein